MKTKLLLTKMLLAVAGLCLGSMSAWGETITKTVASWDFKTASWVKESGFGEGTVTINSQSCTYASGDLEGLALQGGSGTGWTVNANGLTQGNGERNIAILNLKAGDAVTVVTTATISKLINGTSTNDTYTGTCKFSVTADGTFGFATDRSKYTTSITISRQVEAYPINIWNFKTASWVKESGFGEGTITINSQSCTYASGDLDGLALQGGSGTGWTVNANGLTQGNGERNIAILDLKAGDAVTVVTAATISKLVNGASTNDAYTGTCKFSVTANGTFGFATDRNQYTTSITVYREVDYIDVNTWNFKTASWVKESGFGEGTVTINSQSCTYASGDLEGLALQGGSGTGWTVNANGLTQGNGERNIAILDLKAGDAVTVVTAATISKLVNGASTNDAYTGTCKFSVTANGTFGFATDRSNYTTLITVSRPVVSKTITAAGWATYCSPYALDLEHATGLTDAYIVTGGDGSVLAKTSVKGGTVPANTGLLLKGDAGTATIPVVASSSTEVSANKLVGKTESYVLAANGGYVLMNDATNGLGFYKNNKAFTVGANTAYLPIDFDSTGAPVFYLFDNIGGTTGIDAVNGSELTVNGEYYNLAGQRAAQPTKGLYIVNGKKVVVK